MISRSRRRQSTVAPATPGRRASAAEALDDDFLVADQLVDVQGDALDAAAKQQHEL